jgi:hypothetical protein
MKVSEFINKFEQLGYDKDTDLIFGAYDANGEWYNFEFEVEDEDRQLNPHDNAIAVTIDVPEQYLKHELDEELMLENLTDEICAAVCKTIDNFQVIK